MHVVVGIEKHMSSLFDRLETDRNVWKRAETKRQHSSSVVNRIQQNETESNETERYLSWLSVVLLGIGT